MVATGDFASLVELCARLRAPGGCPWDREQTLASVRPYIIEEAYEVDEAIAEGNHEALVSELGDLLFQIVFVAQLASELALFDIARVCDLVHGKMVRRHPHVFGDAEVAGAAEVVRRWEAIKQRERVGRGALDGVPAALPALLKASRITEKAAARGFERPADGREVEAGLRLLAEAPTPPGSPGGRPERAEASRLIGDLLLAVADRARRLGVDPEAALQDANARFAEAFAAARARGEPGSGAAPEGSP